MSGNTLVRKQSVASKVRYWLNAPSRMMIGAYASIVGFMYSVAPTFCTTNSKMNGLFNNMVDIICTIALYVGAIIIVSGIFNWVLAQKDENADGQSRAIKFIVCGFVLVALKAVVNPVLSGLLS